MLQNVGFRDATATMTGRLLDATDLLRPSVFAVAPVADEENRYSASGEDHDERRSGELDPREHSGLERHGL